VFAVSVDEVEKQTDLDFFSKLPDEKEDILEVFVKIEAYGKIRFPR
jgi:DNA/RNA endonuclease G (NUC1)